MKNKDFNKYGHKLVDWMSNYFREIENYPIKGSLKHETDRDIPTCR